MSSDAAQLLSDRLFLTGGGTETYLLFQQKFPMREFCAFEIFEDEEHLALLEERYVHPLLSAIDGQGHGLLMDALVWRAHPDYVSALGYSEADITRLNELAVSRTRSAINDWREASSRTESDFPTLIAADIGPRGDGYRVEDSVPAVDDARNYHLSQMKALAEANADVICAWTMTNANEAIGIVQAATDLGLPIIVSPTVETDGRLPDGSHLADFIRRIDDETGGTPLYYAVNCAHPTHLEPTLREARTKGDGWLDRLKGFRANSSKMSHEELDNSTELDRGDPHELSAEVAAMHRDYDLRLIGGCCGTDVEHISAIAVATAKNQ